MRIEELCWVLEPDRLCLPITSEQWDEERLDDQDIKHKLGLASYFAAQLGQCDQRGCEQR